MESRKIISMNLFAGKTQMQRMDLWTRWGTREWDKRGKQHQHVYTEGARRTAGEKRLCSTGSPIGNPWWPGGMGGGRECKYNYGWSALLNGRNQHNIVKIKKKKKKTTGKWSPAHKGLQQLLRLMAPKWKQHKGSSITWYKYWYTHIWQNKTHQQKDTKYNTGETQKHYAK